LIVATRSWSGDEVPADQFLGFYCPACQRSFELSHRQFRALWDRHEFKLADGRRALVFKCRYCGKLTAVRVDKPPGSGTVVTSAPSRPSHGAGAPGP
jgi:predicted RNA-binding Zn-ribbon protein involved in translation (DUF1610 family)